MTIGGHPVERALVFVPGRGPWFADVDCELDDEVSGRTTLTLGALELEGTVRESAAGTFGLRRRLRLVAGADGWGALLAPKAYHADNGVRARTVAEDAAREAGEELDAAAFEPAAERVGIDYVRQAGAASRVLEDALGGVRWWVGFDGKTRAGERPESAPPASAYEVIEHDPRHGVVVLAVDELDAVGIGSVLSERLDAPQTVRELELDVRPDVVRLRAWCGEDRGYGNLAGALRGFVERVTDRRIYGKRRYRVVRMSSDRVELQAVKRGGDAPDILPISMWPGVAGAHAELTPGAEVLVDFVEGDRTQPVITHFAGRDGNGWTPANLTLDATTLIKLGQNASIFVALADYVDDRLSSLRQTINFNVGQFNAHVHSSSGAGTPTSSEAIQGALASVACTKVKAE